MCNEDQPSVSEIQKLCREIGLRDFNGTVCTTYNRGRYYPMGEYPYESNLEDAPEYVVDGEPLEKYKLIHKGSLHQVQHTSFPGTSSGKYKMNVRINQEIIVKFLNNLHEISQEYRYEVRVIAQTPNYYPVISSGIHTRRDGQLVIQTSTTEIFEPQSRVHGASVILRCFHFIVRRFNINQMKNISDKHIGIGEMLLNDDSYCDASLVVGNRIFPVHKRVLALKSDVFKSMFTHRMAENEDGIVKIDDFDEEVMEELILYIYTNKTKNLSKIPRELFEAAHKYQIADLEEKCKEHMIFNLNFANAVDVLDLTRVYGLHGTRMKVLTFIKKYEEEMVQQENYQDFLYRDLNLDNVTSTLLLCVRYNLDKLKVRVFEFLKELKKDILERKDFMDLFNTQPSLMQEIFRHLVLN